MLTDLHASAAQPSQILERWLARKGNNAVTLVLVTWTGLPASSATWEDYSVIKLRFPEAPVWGQSLQRGSCHTLGTKRQEEVGVLVETRRI